MKQLTTPRQEDDDDLGQTTQSLPDLSALGTEEQTIIPSCRRHEDDDEEEDVRPGQDFIEVVSMIDDNGGRINAEENSESRCSVDPIH